MPLSAAQMGVMSRLLDEALPLDAAGRADWLVRLAPEHRELAAALRRALLPDDTRTAGTCDFATLPKMASIDQADAAAASGLHPGGRIGPYELTRRLGSGGMAEVWLAHRIDGAFERTVALKLPMLWRMRADLAQRFAHERDILAGLEHPNIARLYDAGASAAGLPYLALEYVEGEPLIAWCDAHRLGLRERLKLFLQVLDAVQYAHGHHVIHRDLKPSNILVTIAGQVRLLDFGVAKLLAQDDDADVTQLTQLYGAALTPQYASPEQLRGETLTVASDVYALGVVLYELLTGNRPYGLKPRATPAQVEQAITTGRVAAPSMRIAPEAAAACAMSAPRLARRLHGDLDAIVLKALAKEPQERYAGAEALADDLQRHLSGETVEARPARFTYRLGKFVLRHRAGAAMVSAVAVMVVAAAVFGPDILRAPAGTARPTSTQAASVRSLQTTAAAIPVSDKSIAVLPFVDMSEKKDQEFFFDGLSEELIDRLAQAEGLKVIARTSSFAFKGRNEDVRAIASQLGVAHLLEGSVRKSGKTMRITAQLIKASDGSHVWSQTYERNLADIFKVQDDIAAAVVRELKLALNKGTGKGTKPNIEAHNLVLQGDYLKLRHSWSDIENAIALYQRAIALDSNYALAWARLGSGHWNAAGLMSDRKASDQSISRAREALKQALRIDPNMIWAHYTLAGIQLSADFDWNAARASIDRMREIDPTNDTLLPSAIADVSEVFGRLDEAIEIDRQLLARDPLNTDKLNGLAYLLMNTGRLAESEATFRKLLQMDPVYAGVHAALGRTLVYMGRVDEGLKEIEMEPDEAVRLFSLPIAYWALGQRERSDAFLRAFIEKHGTDSPFSVAEICAYRGEIDAAFRWLDRAYRLRDMNLVSVKGDDLLANLHKDPRFHALLAKMKLPD